MIYTPRLHQLSEAQQRFISLFAAHGDVATAYRDAFDKPRTPMETCRQAGLMLLRERHIAHLVTQQCFAPLRDAVMDARDVVTQWIALARADARELINHRRINCRQCWGVDHAYQWRDKAEFTSAWVSALDANGDKPSSLQRPLPDDKGGYGFKRVNRPHPDCPACDGEGHSDVIVADFETLSPGAALLYDGIKITQHGMEVKMRSRDDALVNIAKWLKVLAPDMPAGHLPPAPGTVVDLPPDIDSATEAYRQLTNGL